MTAMASNVFVGLTTIHGNLPPTFTSEVAESWKGDLEAAYSRIENRWGQIDEGSCLGLWSFDPARELDMQASSALLDEALEYVTCLKSALLSFCDMRMKLRNKLQTGAEFHSVAQLVQKLDSGEKTWGASTSKARPLISGVLESHTMNEQVNGVILNFRPCF